MIAFDESDFHVFGMAAAPVDKPFVFRHFISFECDPQLENIAEEKNSRRFQRRETIQHTEENFRFFRSALNMGIRNQNIFVMIIFHSALIRSTSIGIIRSNSTPYWTWSGDSIVRAIHATV